MHKETLVAVIIGLVLGLALTFGIYQWQKAGRQSTEFNLEEVVPTPTPIALANQEVIITSHQDGIISQEAKISLEGTGPANAFLVIFVNNQEKIGKVDAEKKFKIELELEKGPNTITAIATENNGNTYKTEILLVYEPTE